MARKGQRGSVDKAFTTMGVKREVYLPRGKKVKKKGVESPRIDFLGGKEKIFVSKEVPRHEALGRGGFFRSWC